MKNLFILLIAVCWCQNTLSAQAYSVVYERTTIVDVKAFGVNINFFGDYFKNITTLHLLHKNGVSNYYVDIKKSKEAEKKTMQLSQNKGLPVVGSVTMGNSDKPSILYKNPANGQYLKGTSSLGKPVMIKDKLPQYKWELIEETKVVGSYVCKKATAKQGKDIITAWYAVSIPIQDGPDKYYGLPGLIIDLKHKNDTYRAISVKGTPDVEIIIPNEKKVMSQAEYDKKFKEVSDSFIKSLNKR